jgi:class 3 adenylate cyclase
MGLHSAEPFIHEDGYIGVGVHRAARICAAGHGGQILLSNATAGIVEDLGLDGVGLLDLGEHRLKDIERPQRLIQLVVAGLGSEFPPLKSLDRIAARPAIASLLYTDLVGWGQVMRKLGDERAADIARAYAELVSSAVAAESGRVLEVVGDGILSSFTWPPEAIRAATDIRGALQTEPWFPGDDRPSARMAIHSGRVPDPTSRYLGSVAMHCTALCAEAEPGQILVSHATEALLEGEVMLDVSLRDLGERTVPSFERPVRVFELC